MIGGDDLVLPGATSADDVDAILRLVVAFWPDAVFEVAAVEGGEPIRTSRPFPAARWADVFAYRDDASFTSWKQSGLTPTNAGAAIYVAVEADAISFVVDDRDSSTGLLVRDVIGALEHARREMRVAA